LANLAKVLHSLRVKLNIASHSSNGKVFMWSSQWDLPRPSIQEEIAAANNAATTATTAELSEVPSSRVVDQQVDQKPEALLNDEFTDSSSFKTVHSQPEGGGGALNP